MSFTGSGGLIAVSSGTAVAVPRGIVAPEGFAYHGSLAWVATDGRGLVDAMGAVSAPFDIPPSLRLTGEYAARTTPDQAVSAWGLSEPGSNRHYIALVHEGSPTPYTVLQMIGGQGLRWLDEDTLVLTADYPGTCTGGTASGVGSLPLLLTIGSATARFVTGPLAGCDSLGGEVVMAAWCERRHARERARRLPQPSAAAGGGRPCGRLPRRWRPARGDRQGRSAGRLAAGDCAVGQGRLGRRGVCGTMSGRPLAALLVVVAGAAVPRAAGDGGRRARPRRW